MRIVDADRRSVRTTATAVLLLVVGSVALAVGLGLVPHVVKEGVSATAGLSIALLAAGVVALVAGERRMLRRTGWPSRVAAAITTIALVVLTAMVVAPAVAATHVPETEIGARPADRGLDASDVVVRTENGVALAGWWIAGRNDAAVLLQHGAGSTRSSVLPQAQVLADAGFGVLMLDSHGHGQSEGSAMDFGWQGDAEVAAGVRYLTTEVGIDPTRVGLIGMSMGGEQVIGASAATPVSAIVAEGATGRTAEDKDWLPDAYGWRGSIQLAIERAQYRLTDRLTPASPPTALRRAVAEAEGSFFLLITAGAVPDEAKAASHIAEGAPERVARWEVPNAGHTGALEEDPDGWATRVVAFLERHLLEPEP